MAILSIDTSMAACSAAILPRGALAPIGRFEPMTRGHAEVIFPMIASVMTQAGCDFHSLSLIAVTIGPGSFTGVRAGIAAARGLALATGVPAAGATSLEVMAAGFIRRRTSAKLNERFAIAQDARRGEVYLQSFNASGAPAGEPKLLSNAEAVAILLAEDITLLTGSGSASIALEAERPGRRITALEPDLLPDAADLAMLAATPHGLHHATNPLYLRSPDAKPQFAKILARAQ